MRLARAILSVGAWVCASHALAAPPVHFVPAAELLAAIRGAPEQHGHIALIDYLKARDYSAAVARRTSPGAAEVHRRMTDVWYVVLKYGARTNVPRLTGTRVFKGILVQAQNSPRFGVPDARRWSAMAGPIALFMIRRKVQGLADGRSLHRPDLLTQIVSAKLAI